MLERQTLGVELLVPLVLLIVLAIAAPFFGVDSRPHDSERPTRWYPGVPRD
jgi:hypothetical protein